MDAIKFIEERRRMCNSYRYCAACPGRGDSEYCGLNVDSGTIAEEQVTIIEKWSAEHPRKTKQSVFLEQYPNASLDGDGILQVSPCSVDNRLVENGCCTRGPCSVCARNYWGQEVE